MTLDKHRYSQYSEKLLKESNGDWCFNTCWQESQFQVERLCLRTGSVLSNPLCENIFREAASRCLFRVLWMLITPPLKKAIIPRSLGPLFPQNLCSERTSTDSEYDPRLRGIAFFRGRVWCTLTSKLENTSCDRAWQCVQPAYPVIIAQLKLTKWPPKAAYIVDTFLLRLWISWFLVVCEIC